jgi:hypothetical protein
MFVFIGNLPGDTQLTEIQKLLGERDMQFDYTAYQGRLSNDSDYHFILVKMENSESADSLIDKLRGKSFRGVELDARHFIKRKKQNNWIESERRINQLNLDI